jgi:hypothetical protein
MYHIQTEPYKSLTSIEYDETLHKQIGKFEDKYKELIFSLKEIENISVVDMSYNYENMKEMIERVSEYRKENDIGKFGTAFRHPDNFAFILSVVVDGKRFNRWDEICIKDEMELIGVISTPVKYEDYVYENTIEVNGYSCNINEGITTCICGHSSNTIFFYKSKTTGIVLPIGTSCVLKYEIETDETMKKIQKGIKKEKETLKMMRPCKKCNIDFKAENTKEIECIECRDSKEPKCEYCLNKFKPKQDWIKSCFECYKKHSRECKSCKNMFLPPYKNKDFATMCGKCYYKSKNY